MILLAHWYQPRTPHEINDAGDQIDVAHVYEDHHRVYGNILDGFRQYVRFPSGPCASVTLSISLLANRASWIADPPKVAIPITPNKEGNERA